MNKNCPFCKSLNITALLAGGDELSVKGISDKLIRYYCINPATLHHYCPCAGQRENCRFCNI